MVQIFCEICMKCYQELRGIRSRINRYNLQIVQILVVTLAAEHETERFRDLAAKLPQLSVSLAGSLLSRKLADPCHLLG